MVAMEHVFKLVISSQIYYMLWPLILSSSLSTVGNNPSPCCQRSEAASSALCLPLGSSILNCSAVRKLLSTQRNKPPAAYWVNDMRPSPSCTLVFECRITEDGIRAVAPGGNSTTIFISHSIRCPPLAGLKSPSAVMAHQPYAKLAASLCLRHTVLGPRLNVAAGHMLFLKFFWRVGYREKSASRCLA